ncbi:Khsrp [Symbiodinium natans]|uniref:Khsrp protein n=1 Tax=Symbiodinium natans TaxID=878477 RepID=A0A812V9B0_9DINO|nr:Khsrp [Symbiodinium natans]
MWAEPSARPLNVPGAVPAFQVHAPPFIPLEHLPPPPPVSQPSAFGTPIAFPQVTIPLHAHPVHPAQHAHLPPGPPLIPPPAMMEPPPPPPPPVSASSQAARAPLTDAEVKAAASAALSKFMKEIPDKEPRRSGSRSRRRSKSSSRRSRSKKRSSSHRSRSRSRRRRSRGRKRSKSRRKRSRSREKSRSSLVEPPPVPGAPAPAPSASGGAPPGSGEKRSKWDEASAPAWMQDMMEALKSSDAPKAAAAPLPPKHKNDPDRPKGHKVIELPAHLIRVLIGKAGSTIREVCSRSGCDIKVNHLPHEPQGSISVVGDIERAEAVIQDIFRARGCKWSPTGAPLAEQSEEDVKIPADLVGLFIGKGGETIKELRERCGGQVSITIQPSSTPGGMQGVRVVGDNWKLAKALVRAKIEELTMSKAFKTSGGTAMMMSQLVFERARWTRPSAPSSARKAPQEKPDCLEDLLRRPTRLQELRGFAPNTGALGCLCYKSSAVLSNPSACAEPLS